jgi:hypothetical protein
VGFGVGFGVGTGVGPAVGTWLGRIEARTVGATEASRLAIAEVEPGLALWPGLALVPVGEPAAATSEGNAVGPAAPPRDPRTMIGIATSTAATSTTAARFAGSILIAIEGRARSGVRQPARRSRWQGPDRIVAQASRTAVRR